MSIKAILFFIVGPVIIAIWNLGIGPKRHKHIPMKVHLLSFLLGLALYLMIAYVVYKFLL
ncbi:hypothetical protein [Staphylococcus massiliensis]|uniref:hypothetical protein n=1 Tax=Staphylococcus massiliensis TaxID=555791 RepID=UPI000304E29B|nr:hypothetical protein [Staphylococcus massiliensis]MCG3399438.1 hypothetical protein [Staphylococcus massiliensis]MCG3402462.1 hypothetical protein [Staphylococcus massiliensis]MCG3411574.1 hypothetical protein [Staphylococcus massiliensis]PNZ99471.1 hypothetical protein CD133_06185 [Staphylococcus massiliensis CCUG 55927]